MTLSMQSPEFRQLLEDRINLVASLRKNNFEEGLRKHLSDVYPDEAHFIYELLQNAEDERATAVHFLLDADMLAVTHDGEAFDLDDVERITNIGQSRKRDDVNKIGKFGVGFKAVFSYTETPRVYSGEYSFEIRDLWCPHPIRGIAPDSGVTQFQFPFSSNAQKHRHKSADACFAEIAEGLDSLSDSVLLFLNHIGKITWDIAGKGGGSIVRVDRQRHVVEIRHKRSDAPKKDSSYWLRFQKPVSVDGEQLHVAVAFGLAFKDGRFKRLDESQSIGAQMAINPVEGQLFVYFPAINETTKLLFHIHAPYAAKVTRDSITHNNENRGLVEKTAELLSDSIAVIKDAGLLTTDFLAVLPNKVDGLSDFYEPLLSKVVSVMRAKPLVPAYPQGHSPADDLFSCRADMRHVITVITHKELAFFHDRNPIRWATEVKPNSREERFLNTLAVAEWNLESLASAVGAKFKDSQNLDWLQARSDKWMLRFYALLDQVGRSSRDAWQPAHFYQLTEARVVRLTDGRHVKGEGVFFPNADGLTSEYSLPVVKANVLNDGDNDLVRRARSFLEKIGVERIDERKHIELLLKRKQYSWRPNATESEHLEHMRMFVKWWARFKDASPFQDHMIFRGTDGSYRCGNEVFLDKPFLNTGLSAFYQNARIAGHERVALWTAYTKLDDKQFIAFACSLGVADSLEISETKISGHPDPALDRHLNSGKRTSHEINVDYEIEGLLSCLQMRNRDACKLVWKTVSSADREVLWARARPNAQSEILERPSFLVYLLKRHAWIPDSDGAFHKPAEMTRDLLPSDFPYDDHNGWLTAIGFGEDAHRQSEEHRQKAQMAKSLNVPLELVEACADMTDEERKELIEFAKSQKRRRRIQKGTSDAGALSDYRAEFRLAFRRPATASPDEAVSALGPVADARRRSQRIAGEISQSKAEEPLPEERFRRVPRKVWERKDNQARTSFQQWYQGRCQICNETFAQRNGQPYFEGCYIVWRTGARWIDRPGNVLCLCANCCAKFQHGPVEANDIENQVLTWRARSEGGDGIPKLRVMLCNEGTEIKFDERHMLDLRELLKSSD